MLSLIRASTCLYLVPGHNAGGGQKGEESPEKRDFVKAVTTQRSIIGDPLLFSVDHPDTTCVIVP